MTLKKLITEIPIKQPEGYYGQSEGYLAMLLALACDRTIREDEARKSSPANAVDDRWFGAVRNLRRSLDTFLTVAKEMGSGGEWEIDAEIGKNLLQMMIQERDKIIKVGLVQSQKDLLWSFVNDSIEGGVQQRADDGEQVDLPTYKREILTEMLVVLRERGTASAVSNVFLPEELKDVPAHLIIPEIERAMSELFPWTWKPVEQGPYDHPNQKLNDMLKDGFMLGSAVWHTARAFGVKSAVIRQAITEGEIKVQKEYLDDDF